MPGTGTKNAEPLGKYVCKVEARSVCIFPTLDMDLNAWIFNWQKMIEDERKRVMERLSDDKQIFS